MLKTKEQKGITLISLVITIILLLILATVAISLAVDSEGLFKKAGEAANKWNTSVAGEQQTVTNILETAEEILEEPIITNFYQNGGSIEVKFVDKNNQIIENPLSPVLGTNMMPIKWNGSAWVETNPADAEWYDYNQSKWANAKTADGSMWVWIPRFAYEITYTLANYTNYEETLLDNADTWFFENYIDLEKKEILYDSHYTYYRIYSSNRLEKTKKNGLHTFFTYEPIEGGEYQIKLYQATGELSTNKAVVGYNNSTGMVKNNGKIVLPLESGVETSGKYIVHPAFGTDLSLGGWSEPLAGIWVAKYEMSMETDGVATVTDSDTIGNVLTTSSIKMVSKPDVSSWRNIQIGNIYTNCYNYDRTNESHLMKNSEWGAVAYLSYSQYGRNGTEILANTSEDCITGTGGTAASTTGNETGIYDLSGGALEYLAAYNKCGTDLSYAEDNDSSNFATGIDTKYVTTYENETEYWLGRTLMSEIYKTGDAIREIYSDNSKAWDYDVIFCLDSIYAFIIRGSCYNEEDVNGIFFSNSFDGCDNEFNSFRAVLAP